LALLPLIFTIGLSVTLGFSFGLSSARRIEQDVLASASARLSSGRETLRHMLHAATPELNRLAKELDPSLPSDEIRRRLELARVNGDGRAVALVRTDGTEIVAGSFSAAAVRVLAAPEDDNVNFIPYRPSDQLATGPGLIAVRRLAGGAAYLALEVDLSVFGPPTGQHRRVLTMVIGSQARLETAPDLEPVVAGELPDTPLAISFNQDRRELQGMWIKENLPVWISLCLFTAAAALCSWYTLRWGRRRGLYRAELEALNHSLHLRNIIVQNVGEAMVLLSADGRVLDCNPAMETLSGLTREELIGSMGRAFAEPVIRDAVEYDRACEALRRQIADGEDVRFTQQYRLRAGRVVTLEISMFEVPEASSGAVRVAIMRDITAHHETLDRLKLHAEALEAVNSGVLILSSREDKYSIVYANSSFAALTGYGVEEILGKSSRILESEHADPEAIDLITRAMQSSSRATVEILNKRKDGSPFLNRVSLSPIFLSPGQPASFFVAVLDDVTAQRQTESALRRQALVLQTIDDFVIAVDREGTITDCNAAAGRFFGSGPDSLLGRKVWNVNTEDVGTLPHDEVQAAMTAGEPWRRRMWVRSGTGARRLVDVHAAPMQDANDRYKGYVAISRDCTEAWEADAQLKLHALIMEQMQDGVVVFDPANVVIECNQAICDLLGVRRADVIGRNWWSFVVAESEPEREHHAVAEELDDAGHILRERTLRRSDGSTLDVENAKFPLRDSDGALIGYVMVARDLSTRREAERRYQRSQTLYAGLVESAMDAIISIDENQRIVVFNRAAEEMFRCKAGEAIGEPLAKFLPERFREKHGDYVARYGRAGGTARTMNALGEVAGRRADGTEFPIEASISHVQTDDGRIFTAIVRDLTAARAIEGQLRQAEKMQAVGQLSGGIAHDFNNMLSVIGNSIDIALDNAGTGKHAEAALNRANRAVESAANLVEKLLAFSRKGATVTTIGRVEDVVWDMMPVLFRTLPENIKIKADIAEHLPAVAFDAAQLENALLNLAINARDAMPNGGALMIRVGNAKDQDSRRRRVLGDRDFVALEIVDTGCGMSAAVRERALEPFFTTKAAGQGTGLGLSMVYTMIEQCHGRLEIDSAEGKGTTIRLLFPVAEGEAQVRRRRSADIIRGNGESVLVVEDNADLRYAMIEQLRSIGYTPLEAKDCAHAIDILSGDTRVDVLLSDVIMASDMNGKELAQRAGQLRPGIKVILCTGYAHTVLETGVDPEWQVLRKPVTRRQLADALASSLDTAIQAPAA
jgi:PAS domain S-box-containing protein